MWEDSLPQEMSASHVHLPVPTSHLYHSLFNKVLIFTHSELGLWQLCNEYSYTMSVTYDLYISICESLLYTRISFLRILQIYAVSAHVRSFEFKVFALTHFGGQTRSRLGRMRPSDFI
jgi:hypothetical protein